jgi:VIT1/CCC1 family predicted Fe2+/Mn2+ transporter
MVRHSLRTGLSFGLTSGIITTLGLMVGLHAFSGSKLVVVGGILTIAIADACSDALGIHLAEEAETVHTGREVWESTFATFLAKFAFALLFTVPVLLLDLELAIVVSVAVGLVVLAVLSYTIAAAQQESSWRVVTEHLLIVIVVISLTHYVGDWINVTFTS